MQQSFLSINKLSEKPYVTIIGYPNSTKKQVQIRIAQMKKLGINSVSFQGDLKLGSISVLGKGYVGIVVLAKRRRKIVAVKIRRTDSQRKEMRSEAKLLQIANSSGVGPSLITSSKNFMVMDYLDGKKIGLWIKELKGKGSTLKLKSIIKKTLEDCYKLDKVGLDHGELSSITKHVIVGKSKTTIIDFESSSTKRRVSNVTSATQGIFIGSGISKSVKKIYKVPPKDKIIDSLRNYKKDSSRKNFDMLLKILKV
jgi:putative serine/threonine protein kinase